MGEITDTAGVHGIALAPDLDGPSRATGRANSSTIVDLKTLKPLGTVPTGANPDSIRYLRDRREVSTFNHTGGSITAFDPTSGKVIATIEVGGELEEAVEDAAANRVYVNVEDKGAIAVVDTEQVTLLRAQHCDAVQGYRLSPPLLAEAVTQRLLEGAITDVGLLE